MRAVLSIAVLAACSAACGNGDQGPARAETCTIDDLLVSQRATVEIGQPLRLSACAVDSEIGPGDPVRFLVLLQNVSNEPVKVFAHLTLGSDLYVNVTGPDGEPAATAPGAGSYEPGRAPPYVTTVIPAGGFLGTMVELRCGEGEPLPGSVEPCISLFAFNEPGRYEVTVKDELWWCQDVVCPASAGNTMTLAAPKRSVYVVSR